MPDFANFSEIPEFSGNYSLPEENIEVVLVYKSSDGKLGIDYINKFPAREERGVKYAMYKDNRIPIEKIEDNRYRLSNPENANLLRELFDS